MYLFINSFLKKNLNFNNLEHDESNFEILHDIRSINYYKF